MSSSDPHQDHNGTNSSIKVTASPTVEELLKMLSSGSSNQASRMQHPPPLPPKPRGECGMTIEAAKRSLGLLPTEDKTSNNRTFVRINKATEAAFDRNKKYHNNFKMNRTEDFTKLNPVQHETKINDNGDDPSSTHPTTMQQQRHQQVPPRARAPIGGYVVYDSARTKATLNNNHLTTSTVTIKQDSSTSTRSRPIVTEYFDEIYSNSNNNNYDNNDLAVRRAMKAAADTVEILEVPVESSSGSQANHRNHSVRLCNDNGTPSTAKIGCDENDKVQQHDKSTSHMTPFITPATDDDDSDNVVDFDVKSPMPSNEVTESIFSQSTDGGGPPRTSTPSSSTNCHQQYSASSSSGNSTGTNNNISSQNTYLSHGTKETSSSESQAGDTLNISRETDELTNSVLNQSGGCELIGVNDNSDSKEQSPHIASHHQAIQRDQPPYTVQFFNGTLMSSKSNLSPEMMAIGNIAHNNTVSSEQFASTNPMVREQESENLKKLVSTLQNEITSLNQKVASLTSKVDDLEYQLDVHRKENINCLSRSVTTNSLSSTGATHQRDKLSSPSAVVGGGSGSLFKQTLSQSMSTINRFAPMKTARHNNSSYGQTYSRNATPLSSQRHHQYDYDKSSQALSAPRQYSAGDRTTLRNSNNHYHASTNSLYAGDANNSSSVSPIFNDNNGHSRYSTLSPNSLMNISRDKRDLNTCVSMLSLSSISNSTLKKGSIAGSMSNLSQVGGVNANLISQWPSQSNFMPSKHQNRDVLFDEDERVIRMVLYNTLITMRLPTWIGSDYNFDKLVEPPTVKLKLDWVHGYRGKDCRSNLYYLPTGECIYFIASIVVLYNAEAKTQRHYLGHTDNVKCLAVHPNKLIVASGQSAVLNRRDKRPIVRVWNTVSLATLRVIGFNEDFDRSICCLAFSRHDQGATLAVVDESSEHTITLLDWQREKNWRIAEANSGHEPVLAIDFHPIDKYSIVAVGKSSVNFWDIRGMTLAKKAGLFDKYDRPKYVLCFTFNDLGETITGDSNGNIIIWPRGANKPRKIIRDAHTGGVFSILAMKDGNYLTGGRDRQIIEWDESFAPTGRHAELPEHCGGVRFITYAKGFHVLIGTLRNCILIGSLDSEFSLVMQGHTEATTALAIHPTQRKYLTGGFDDQIYLMDCMSRQVEWSKCIAQPITAASFSPNGLILILGSVSGNWNVLDAVTQEILFDACDGSGTISCIKFSPNGQQFCLGSSDCHVYIYATNESASEFRRIGTCVGHSAPIKEIDWSDDNYYIQTQSMNFELLFWKANNCRQVDDESIVHDLRWHTQNCTIGFNTMGIWSDSIDSALINYCDRSNNGDLIVSSTDTGFINVYKAPAYYNQCLSHKYYGNVDKFNFIRFLKDDTRLIAVGAKNCVTTEWTIDRTD